MFTSINHNLMAANTARNFNSHYSNLAISTKRLSSGLRINSAADDAAGLAIRELQRADIAALHQGARNAYDAISMLQVADGALAIIDEKLIRMKELAEQAATGTYDSTQRLMIDSEFRAMADEIDRIAHATDFNGIKLLDGSLSGAHNGIGMKSSGAMKIHFGSGNDSAEDYYYVNIGDCSTGGLGLKSQNDPDSRDPLNGRLINDAPSLAEHLRNPPPVIDLGPQRSFTALNMQEGQWYWTRGGVYAQSFTIPAGTTNVLINLFGTWKDGTNGDDMQLFTKDGVHLAGTATGDIDYRRSPVKDYGVLWGFDPNKYDDSKLNSGPASYNPDKNFKYTEYNGMKIGYSGDADWHDAVPNNNTFETWDDYEIITIDKVTEDLIVSFIGDGSLYVKLYWGDFKNTDVTTGEGELVRIDTQEKAQKALVRINDAIVAKDKIRANLGAMQNRLENTLSNLNIQAENLLASESRISDADVAIEMTAFVRNQILTQSAVAMLSQANSMPKIAMQLLGG